MSVLARVHMPPLGGATEWLDSEPLGPAELRGHVVLVNFWTLTCINWLRQAPYVRAWSHAYRDDGLVEAGVAGGGAAILPTFTPQLSVLSTYSWIVQNVWRSHGSTLVCE